MGLEEFETLLTSPPVAERFVLANEDPFEGPFVAPIVFDGAEYLVLPGAAADAATACQFLLDALSDMPTSAAEPLAAMRWDAGRLLWVSNLAARRAGLERWQAPKYDKDPAVHLPAGQGLGRLEAAVAIEDADVEQYGGIQAFADLCWPQGRVRPRRSPSRLVDDRALLYPLSLASDAESLIIPMPSQLAFALVHRIAVQATRSGLDEHLAPAFERVVLSEATRLCRSMGWVPLDAPAELGLSSDLCEALFAFDLDKTAHVVVFADDFSGHKAGKPHSLTDAASRLSRVHDRMRHVRRAAAASDLDGPVLHLLIAVPVGRPMHADFASLIRDEGSVLMLSMDDLRTISYHERDDPLGLWKFRNSLDEMPIPLYGAGTTAVDAYALYLALDRRPRRLGGPHAAPVLLGPGFGGPLVVEQRQRADVHTVALPGSTELVQVQRATARGVSPVYVPQQSDLRHLRFVELAVPFWVSAHGADESSQHYCASVSDAVAHHLGRIRDIVDAHLAEVAEDGRPVIVEIVDPDASAQTFEDPEGAPHAPWFEITTDSEMRRITVRLLANSAARLANMSKNAEGELIQAVVSSLAELVSSASGAVTPSGLALDELPRFMHVSVGDVPGWHGDSALAPCRLKHHAELDAIADRVDIIATEIAQGPGVVPSSQRAMVVEQIVRALHSELVDGLRRLDRVQAFEFLLSEQERMHNDRTRLRVTTPSEFADADSESHASEAIKRFYEINQSSLASRFLIETAVRCTGGGHQLLSLSRYDELLAIAEHIIGLGLMGDAYRHGLSDPEMRIHEPGVLRFGHRDEFRDTLSSHMASNAQAFVHQDTLAEWAGFAADRDRAPSLTHSEEAQAFETEFRIPFMGFVEGIERLRELAASTMLQVATVPVSALENDIAEQTWLTTQQASTLLRMLTLSTTNGDAEPDLFDPRYSPWRFSRDHSLLRRPLLVSNNGDDGLVASWGARAPWFAVEALLEQMGTGRLNCKSLEMKQYMSRHRKRASDQFVEEVADLFRTDPYNRVRIQRSSLGSTSLKRRKGNPLGDIDVLVINNRQKFIHLVEAKNFAAARSAGEIKGEVDKLTVGKQAALVHHRERVQFVRDRWPALHLQMQLAGHHSDWQIRDTFVTNAPSIAAELLQRRGVLAGASVTSFDDLRDQLLPPHGSSSAA